MTVYSVRELEREHPEWAPWLAVIRVIRAETDNPVWQEGFDGRVSAAASVCGVAPLLAQPIVVPPWRHVERLWRELVHRYSELIPQAVTVPTTALDPHFVRAVFRAGLGGDARRSRALAAESNINLALFDAIASLLPVPWLHAVRRASDAIPKAWASGYCPCCGAWPAHAQVCGIERTRYACCGRCGSAWHASVLSCAYCGNADHRQLGVLRIDDERDRRVIEVCGGCKGYVKTFTTLTLGSAEDHLLQDLASVDLDIAASERGYHRPSGPGYALAAAS